MRVLGTRLGSNIEPNEAAAADQIRRELEAGPRPDLPLAFSELHQALSTRILDPQVRIFTSIVILFRYAYNTTP